MCRHRVNAVLGYVSIAPFSNVSVFLSLRFRMILNRFHYSVFAKSAWHEKGGVSITPFSFVFISFVRTRFETEDVVQIVVLVFRMTPFSVFPLKTMRFQMSPFSNHSTLNSVFKCLRFRSFSMEALTQKRRHSTPFSYFDWKRGLKQTGIQVLVERLIFSFSQTT